MATMASSRRFLNSLARQTRIIFFSSSTSHSLLTSPSLQRLPLFLSPHFHPPLSRHFSYDSKNPNTRPPTVHDQDHSEVDEDDDNDDDDDEVDYTSEEDDDDDEIQVSNEPSNLADRSYFVEEKILEAAHIGYKVIGPLQPGDRVFKSYEPAFAVVQVGSHQFKVSNGDCIYVEKLKYCEVNDKLILNKVLMAGSQSQTMIGRPILLDIAVHAVVEEHALDAKVIIFKKKRRKNYRRTKGHRQELTRLRITDIQGIEKPETTPVGKAPMTSVKKVEKVAMAV